MSNIHNHTATHGEIRRTVEDRIARTESGTALRNCVDAMRIGYPITEWRRAWIEAQQQLAFDRALLAAIDADEKLEPEREAKRQAEAQAAADADAARLAALRAQPMSDVVRAWSDHSTAALVEKIEKARADG